MHVAPLLAAAVRQPCAVRHDQVSRLLAMHAHQGWWDLRSRHVPHKDVGVVWFDAEVADVGEGAHNTLSKADGPRCKTFLRCPGLLEERATKATGDAPPLAAAGGVVDDLRTGHDSVGLPDRLDDPLDDDGRIGGPSTSPDSSGSSPDDGWCDLAMDQHEAGGGGDGTFGGRPGRRRGRRPDAA